MIPGIFLLIVVAVGCIAPIKHSSAGLEDKELAMEIDRRKKAEDRVTLLEEENKKLTRALRSRVLITNIPKEDLDEIKKQALEEAEKKYKARIIRGKANQSP